MDGFGEQKLAVPMRIMGGLLILFSIIEFGVGGAAYEFLRSVHVGGWWAGIVTCISAFFALMSNNRCIIITGCVFSVIAMILAVIAAIVDGAQAGNINSLTGCFEPTTGDTWGTDSGITSAQLCYVSSDDAFNYYGGRTSQCICSDSAGLCYGFSLQSGSDCNNLFTTYYDELSASCAFCVVLAVLSLIYAILTCVNCCSPEVVTAGGQPGLPVAPVNLSVQAGGVMYAPTPHVAYIQPQTGPVMVGPGGQLVYAAAPPQSYPQGSVMYAQQPQQPQQVPIYQQQQPPQQQYVYQDPSHMPVLEAQPVYDHQQTKWA